MKIPMHPRLACPLALWTLVSCAVPGVETDRMEPAVPAQDHRAMQPRRSLWADAEHMVRGTVVDRSGTPIAAKVALVSARGSSSTSVSDGTFELGTNGAFPRTLCAWTEDGQIGWRVLETPPGDDAVNLEVDQDGAFLTLVAGDHNDRVSILSGGVPLNNVKFPAGVARAFVVPAGEISFGTVGTDEHAADRRSARLSPGSSMTARF